jgi:hypothetical protein
MAQKLISLMIEEKLYADLRQYSIDNGVKTKIFIANAIRKELEYVTTRRTTKRTK